jgi:hypothetical protein
MALQQPLKLQMIIPHMLHLQVLHLQQLVKLDWFLLLLLQIGIKSLRVMVLGQIFPL